MRKYNHNTFKRRNPDEDANYLPLTIENIYEQEEKVQADPYYGKNGNGLLLRDLFSQKPNNYDYITVAHKILLIDYTNSTRLKQRKAIVTIYDLARKIVTIQDLDYRIQQGDPSVVDEIATISSVNFFSFASKFCFYHNKEKYSIFDGVVTETIPQYLDVTQQYIKDCKNFVDNKSYKDFRDIIDKLIIAYDLGSVPNIREKLDHFLWYANKDRDKDNNKEENSSDSSSGNND